MYRSVRRVNRVRVRGSSSGVCHSAQNVNSEHTRSLWSQSTNTWYARLDLEDSLSGIYCSARKVTSERVWDSDDSMSRVCFFCSKSKHKREQLKLFETCRKCISQSAVNCSSILPRVHCLTQRWKQLTVWMRLSNEVELHEIFPIYLLHTRLLYNHTSFEYLLFKLSISWHFPPLQRSYSM